MLGIGQLSRRTGVKVPTIRYYEDIGLLENAGRTMGNQRRYDQGGIDRLTFIKHARDLGFSLDAIRSLVKLHGTQDKTCSTATSIASGQLADVRQKIAALTRLEAELDRISNACDTGACLDECSVLTALADHSGCSGDHV